MEMLGIVLVWTGRGRIVELQPRIIQLLKSDLARVKPHNGVIAEKLKKLAALFLAGSEFCFVGERFEQFSLPGRQKRKELFAFSLSSTVVQPSQTGSEVALQVWISRYHEVDEFSDSGI